MLDESYVLEYKIEVLEDMSKARREVFEGPLRKFVISSTRVWDTQTIRFHFYRDHLLEAVKKWPWLLCSNLGANLERCYVEEEVTYNSVVSTPWRSIAYRQGKNKP